MAFINKKSNNSNQNHLELPKNRLRKAIILVVTLCAIVSGYLLVDYLNLFNARNDRIDRQRIESLGISTTPISKKQVDEHQVQPDEPRYISIPSAGIDKSRVLAIGVNKPSQNGSQQLGSPSSTSDVGWYNCQINPVVDKRCADPKQPGDGNVKVAALIDGHTCFSKTMSCVFDNISKLKHDTSIIIERGDGKQLDYRVKKIEVLNLADVDMKKAMQPIESDKEGLTLITCAGSYRGATDANGVQTSDKRVLVYASLQ